MHKNKKNNTIKKNKQYKQTIKKNMLSFNSFVFGRSHKKQNYNIIYQTQNKKHKTKHTRNTQKTLKGLFLLAYQIFRKLPKGKKFWHLQKF